MTKKKHFNLKCINSTFFYTIIALFIMTLTLFLSDRNNSIYQTHIQYLFINNQVNFLTSFTDSLQLSIPIEIMRIIFYITPIFFIISLEKFYRMYLEEKTLPYAMFFLILSPAFLFHVIVYNTYLLAFSSILLSSFLTLKKKYLLASVMFLITLILKQEFWLLIVLILLITLKKEDKHFDLNALLLFGFSIGIFVLSEALDFSDDILSYLISDFGAFIGISLISLILLFLSFFVLREEQQILFKIIPLAILAIATLFNEFYILPFTVFMSIFLGEGLKRIINMDWESKMLQYMILLLCFVGICMSAYYYVENLSFSGPSQAEMESLEWMKLNVEKGKIISFYKYEPFIRNYGFDTFTENNYYRTSKKKEKLEIANSLFRTTSLDTAKKIIETNELKYIWINEKMKNGQIFHEKEEGVLLVLENTKNFEKIYSKNNVDIWRYIQNNTLAK